MQPTESCAAGRACWRFAWRRFLGAVAATLSMMPAPAAIAGARSQAAATPVDAANAFCDLPADSAEARLGLFRADVWGMRLAFAERLARCRSARDVTPCLTQIALADVRVNTDVLRESLLVRDLRLVPSLSRAERQAWLQGVRDEQAAIQQGAPSDAQAGLFERATLSYKESTHLRREALVLGSLGRCLLALGRSDEAFAAYTRALDARTRLGDPRLIELSLRSLGSTELQRGRPAAAVTYYEQALAAGEARGDRRSVVVTLEFLGQTYRKLSQFETALRYYERAQLDAGLLAPGDPTVNLVQIGLAQACRELGDVQRARRILAAELGRLRGLGEPENLRTARTRSLYGDALQLTGQLGPALEQLRLATAALDSLGAWSDLARAENFMARVCGELGERPEALRHSRLARTHAMTSGNTEDLGFAWMNAGMAFAAMGAVDSSQASFGRALAVAEQAGNEPLTTSVLQHWADALNEAMQGRDAEAVIRKAIAINERSAGSTQLALNYMTLGNALGAQQRLPEGRLAYRQALGAPGGAVPHLRFGVELGLADNFELAGELDSAQVHCERAVRMLEAWRADLPVADVYRVSFLRSKALAYRALLHVFARLDARSPDQGYAERAFDVTELARARALLERMPGANAVPPGAGRLNQLAQPAGMQQVQHRLLPRDREVLLEYACSDSLAYLWVVTSAHVTLRRLASPTAIGTAVRELRRTIQRQDDTFIEPARHLYDLLLAPAAAELRRARVVYIVPEGDLFLVPFETLIERAPRREASDPAPPQPREDAAAMKTRGVRPAPAASRSAGRPALAGIRYSLSDAVVQYGPSASVLAALDSTVTWAADGPPSLFAIGDPETQGHFAPLPDAAAEAQRIGALFPAGRRQVLLGEAAREDSVSAAPLARYQYLHFATHGVVDSLVSERSHLVLCSAPPGDGELQVPEIERLDLRARLAVLSACDTGLGSVVSGEGVMGLARAFLIAGSRAVVVSLWSVQDRSTAVLMEAMYADLIQHQQPAGRALAQAKKKLRTSKEFAHPMFWSPFVLVGPGD